MIFTKKFKLGIESWSRGGLEFSKYVEIREYSVITLEGVMLKITIALKFKVKKFHHKARK